MNDPQGMALAAIELIDNPELRKKLAKNGFNHIQNFSYDRVVPVLENILIKKIYD
jgi:glycosyltransferase involved in cell wall biosynthesis